MSQAGFTDPPRVPEGLSVIAFGDVHGRLDKLEALLSRIEARAAQRPERRHLVISLGDLVDRGPDSAGVVARMLRGVAGCELVVLRGNHEQVLLDFLLGQPDGLNTINLGGLETMASYGLDVRPERLEQLTLGDLRRGFLGVLPPDHRRFLAGLPCCKTVGDYFFVHAGVRPGIALEDQDEEDMLWIRDAFFEERRRFAKKIVHGHTPVEAPEFLDNRINLDTGAVFGGRLTAALFEDDRAGLF